MDAIERGIEGTIEESRCLWHVYELYLTVKQRYWVS